MLSVESTHAQCLSSKDLHEWYVPILFYHNYHWCTTCIFTGESMGKDDYYVMMVPWNF